ncbi:CAP domain-containing protein [Methylobacterium oxalidis]|uniref:CAP domain-containing protein n=1 Tax=Methylobacterium oxalidis TaxID=944322 RepID=UPI0033158D25
MAIPTALETEFLQLVNDTRAQAGVNPLSFDSELQSAAAAHNAEMDQADLFSHTGPNGSTVSARIEDAGYGWQGYGENIAYVSGGLDEATVQKLHSMLVNSPGHYANIVNGSFEEVGIGLKQGTIGGYDVVFVTEDFGTPNAAERADGTGLEATTTTGTMSAPNVTTAATAVTTNAADATATGTTQAPTTTETSAPTSATDTTPAATTDTASTTDVTKATTGTADPANATDATKATTVGTIAMSGATDTIEVTAADTTDTASTTNTTQTKPTEAGAIVTTDTPDTIEVTAAGTTDATSATDTTHTNSEATTDHGHWHHSWNHDHGDSFVFDTPQAGSTTVTVPGQTADAADLTNTAANIDAGDQGFRHGGCADHVDASQADFSGNVFGHHFNGHTDFHL